MDAQSKPAWNELPKQIRDDWMQHGRELTPVMENVVEALTAELDSAAILEAVQTRDSSLTPVMRKTLQLRPPSRWGINE